MAIQPAADQKKAEKIILYYKEVGGYSGVFRNPEGKWGRFKCFFCFCEEALENNWERTPENPPRLDLRKLPILSRCRGIKIHQAFMKRLVKKGRKS